MFTDKKLTHNFCYTSRTYTSNNSSNIQRSDGDLSLWPTIGTSLLTFQPNFIVALGRVHVFSHRPVTYLGRLCHHPSDDIRCDRCTGPVLWPSDTSGSSLRYSGYSCPRWSADLCAGQNKTDATGWSSMNKGTPSTERPTSGGHQVLFSSSNTVTAVIKTALNFHNVSPAFQEFWREPKRDHWG